MLALNFTPFPELKTQRLLLRKLEKTDANEMFFLRSNEDVLRYIGREPTKTIAEAEEFINMINKNVDENESILWGITFLNDPSLVIGTICIKGIMKEAINAVVDYGFTVLNLHSIEALLDPKNIASSSVLESTGFVKEGHIKESLYFNGEFKDEAIYSRLK